MGQSVITDIFYLSAPRRASTNEPSSSKSSQMPPGRRRLSNGHMLLLRTPTTLVRSKVSNTPSKILARYSIILFQILKSYKRLSNILCPVDDFSRVLRRSINNARLYKKHKKTPASQQYCMFYNRFGKNRSSLVYLGILSTWQSDSYV